MIGKEIYDHNGKLLSSTKYVWDKRIISDQISYIASRYDVVNMHNASNPLDGTYAPILIEKIIKYFVRKEVLSLIQSMVLLIPMDIRKKHMKLRMHFLILIRK